jgi:hypothetical protein
MRETPRKYPIFNIAIFDVDDPANEGYIQDISDKGIRISGINIKPQQKKTFMIQADQFDNVHPFSFDAECKWCSPATDDEPCACGFEIITISDHDREELLKIIDMLSLSD